MADNTYDDDYSHFISASWWPTKPPTTIKWINWRWPRYEWDDQKRRIVFQYYVRNGVVLHQIIVQSKDGKALESPLKLETDMCIQLVDEISPEYHRAEAQARVWDEKCYGAVQIAEFTPSKKEGKKSRTYEVAAVIDVFINGNRTVPSKEGYFELPLMSQSVPNKNESSLITEIVVAYRLNHMRSKPSWKDLIIPTQDADVEAFIRAESDSTSKHICHTSLALQSLFESHTEPSSNKEQATPKIAVPEDQETQDAKKIETQDTKREETDDRPRIQYLASRHLEHILSVCAIPVPDPGKGLRASPGVALTCGDMAGHRVCTSASL